MRYFEYFTLRHSVAVALTLLCVSLLGGLAQAEIAYGPARDVDPVIQYTPVSAGVFEVASNGSEWLAVHRTESSNSLVGTRVSPTGALLDSPALAVANAIWVSAPDVAFDGSDYVVAWAEGSSSANVVRMRRISSNGALGPSIDIARLAATASAFVRVAVNGASILVVWCNYDMPLRACAAARIYGTNVVGITQFTASSTGPFDVAGSGGSWLVVLPTATSDLEAVRLSEDGVLLDDPKLSIAKTAELEQYPTVVATSTGWLAAWMHGVSVRAARISRGGSLESVPLPAWNETETYLENPRLAAAFNGHVLTALRAADCAGCQPELRAQFFDAELEPATEEPVVLTRLAEWASWLSPAGSSDTLLVGLHSWNRTASGLRVDAQGTPLDSTPFAISLSAGFQTAPRSAAGPGGWLVTWYEWRGNKSSTYARRLDMEGNPVGRVVQLSSSDDWRHPPAVAGNTAGWLAVYKHTDTELYARRVSEDGQLGTPMKLGSGDSYQVLDTPNSWLVARVTGDGVGGGAVVIQSLDLSGALVDPTPRQISADGEATFVDLDKNGAGYVVSWAGVDGGLYALALDLVGEPLGARIQILPPNSRTRRAQLAFSQGSAWLLSQRDQDMEFRPLVPAGAISPLAQALYGAELGSAAGQAIFSWNDSEEGNVKLALAQPGASYVQVQAPPFSSGSFIASMSAESPHGTLLAVEHGRMINGLPTARIQSSVLRITASDAGAVADAHSDADSGELQDADLDGSLTHDSGIRDDAALAPDGGVGSERDGGSDARADASASRPPNSDEDGCDCRIATASPKPAHAFAWVFAALAYLAHRRRGGRRSSS